MATFECKASLSNINENCFLTINKFKSPGKFQPVFKSECKPQIQGKTPWNKIITTTDTLCDHDFDQDIMFQVFKYSPNGNHKKVGQATI